MRIEDNINVGDEVVFFEGKNDRPVAYCWSGKVILCRHKIPLGYARVTSVQDKGRYFLVEAEHIVDDLYTGILYDEFIQVLPLHGYKIGFDRIFKNNEVTVVHDEHQILAYNKEIGTIIVAETCGAFHDGTMNTINVYCPNVSLTDVMRSRYFSHGGGLMTVLDLASYRFHNDAGLLKKVENLVGADGARWPDDQSISLWTYEDKNASLNGKELTLWESTICRIYAAPEVLTMLNNCTNFMTKLAILKKKGALNIVMDKNGKLLESNTGM